MSTPPLYRLVQRALMDDIGERRLRPGDRLWSENEIAEKFGVARSVARQALADLEQQGIVERFRGRGSFLASSTPRDDLLSSARGLHSAAAARGQLVTSRVLTSTIDPAPEHVALKLGIEPDQLCFHLVRVRMADGEPWTFVDSWINADLVPGITGHDFSSGSLYDHLADRYGLLVTSASRSVEAAAADPAVAEHLGISVGEPVLVLRSLGRDPSRRPTEVFTAWHRADRSRFLIEVSNVRLGGHVELEASQ